MKSRIILIAAIISFLFAAIYPPISEAQSLFADKKARAVGDILTVLVVESSTASSRAKTETNKVNDHGVLAKGGSGTLAYSPMYGINGRVNNKFAGDALVSRKGALRTTITVQIKEVKPNGNLVVEGKRALEVNGEKEMTTITGIVRPQDISGMNTIYSYQLADAQISYKGKGVVQTGQRPGILTRILNWIF
ncbi:flagellar basal body L-ring protein FlgH [bacterium]|nr:flagellar basal body L-ring protein FlgH [bacterium]